MLDSILIVVLFLASLANALVGSIVLLRNNKRQLNRMFFALSLSIAGWTASNALFQLAASQSSKFTVALISYGFAAVLGVYFYSFCVTLTKDYLPEKTAVSRGLMVAGAIAGLLSLIPGIVGLRVEANGEIITNNAGLALYGLVLISLLARSIYLLFASRKYSPVRERNLTNTIIISFTAALLIGLFFNLILPLIHIYDYVVIGPIGSLVLVGGTAYTIIRHKLFDIKLIIARSIAYVASLGAFAAVYGFVVFGLAQIFFDFKFPITVQILLSVATGVAALSFHYFKSAFDKTTNRLFYQDAYSAEELFDEVAPAYEPPVMLSPSWGRLLACARNQQRKTKDSHHDYFEGAFVNGVDIKEGLEVRVIELILGS